MLTFLDALRWDLLADGIQVALCGVILVCLVHNKLKYKRLLPEAPRRGAPPVFSQEVLLQTLRQQAEQALASIRAAVDAEEASCSRSWAPPGCRDRSNPRARQRSRPITSRFAWGRASRTASKPCRAAAPDWANSPRRA